MPASHFAVSRPGWPVSRLIFTLYKCLNLDLLYVNKGCAFYENCHSVHWNTWTRHWKLNSSFIECLAHVWGEKKKLTICTVPERNLYSASAEKPNTTQLSCVRRDQNPLSYFCHQSVALIQNTLIFLQTEWKAHTEEASVNLQGLEWGYPSAEAVTGLAFKGRGCRTPFANLCSPLLRGIRGHQLSAGWEAPP